MYKDTKIERFTLHPDIQEKFEATKDFDLIDGFKERIKPYVFTDISIQQDTAHMEEAFQSRLQMLMSSILLRALILKDGLVMALNNNNFPSFHASLKSFFEVPALLGYIAEQISEVDDYNRLIEAMRPLILGSGPAGSLRIGNIDAVHIGDMFKALDRVCKRACIASGQEGKEVQKRENIFSTLYGSICNYGHINWDAHLSAGLQLDGVWRAHKEVDGYKSQLYAFYMPSFISGIEAIEWMCGLIIHNSKVKNFSKLNNPRYFD